MSGMRKVIWGLAILLHTSISSHVFGKQSNEQKQSQDSGFPLEACKILCNNRTLRYSKGRNTTMSVRALLVTMSEEQQVAKKAQGVSPPGG